MLGVLLCGNWRSWLLSWFLRSRSPSRRARSAEPRTPRNALAIRAAGLGPAAGGSDVPKRIAAPVWGGLVSLTILTLLAIPSVYVVWRSFGSSHEAKRQATLVLAEPE